MKDAFYPKLFLALALLGGWIGLTSYISHQYTYVDEDRFNYVVHDVPAVIRNAQGMEFVYIKPGLFEMGGGYWLPQEVIIGEGFYFQTTEVTQGQWLAIMHHNPSHFQDCGANCPVEMVSKDDVNVFLHALNAQQTRYHYRLPNEGEWEYVARTGNTITAQGRAQYEASLDEYGWFSLNAAERTHPVASKRPNRLGIFDLQGNVLEWCDKGYLAYPGKRIVDPWPYPSMKTGFHIARGGSWRSIYYFCQPYYRSGRNPNYQYKDVGLRLVIDVTKSRL